MSTVDVPQREQFPSLRRIAVLGLGEAGGRIAADLAAAGVEVRGFDPDPARDVRSISRVPDAASAASGCDVVLSVNSAKAALAAAEAALPGLQASAVYADANTASPELKRELAALVADAGVGFADVALLGPIPDSWALRSGARLGSCRAGVRGPPRTVGHAGRGRLGRGR